MVPDFFSNISLYLKLRPAWKFFVWQFLIIAAKT
jgi:hypothetical protein